MRRRHRFADSIIVVFLRFLLIIICRWWMAILLGFVYSTMSKIDISGEIKWDVVQTYCARLSEREKALLQ